MSLGARTSCLPLRGRLSAVVMQVTASPRPGPPWAAPAFCVPAWGAGAAALRSPSVWLSCPAHPGAPLGCPWAVVRQAAVPTVLSHLPSRPRLRPIWSQLFIKTSLLSPGMSRVPSTVSPWRGVGHRCPLEPTCPQACSGRPCSFVHRAGLLVSHPGDRGRGVIYVLGERALSSCSFPVCVPIPGPSVSAGRFRRSWGSDLQDTGLDTHLGTVGQAELTAAVSRFGQHQPLPRSPKMRTRSPLGAA